MDTDKLFHLDDHDPASKTRIAPLNDAVEERRRSVVSLGDHETNSSLEGSISDESISFTGLSHSDGEESISLAGDEPSHLRRASDRMMIGENLNSTVDSDDDSLLWDVEQCVEKGTEGDSEKIDSGRAANDPVTEYRSNAIKILKFLGLGTNIAILVVALSASLARTSHTYLHPALIVVLFCAQTAIFVARERLLDTRRSLILKKAAKSSAIVNSLFPTVVRDRVVGGANEGDDTNMHRMSYHSRASGTRTPPPRFFPMTAKRRLEKYLTNASSSGNTTPTLLDTACTLFADEPIAEMFHNTTIMFADIAGFTAWSSERAPPQVFQLLETLYQTFDQIARKLGVFKVETIGDCYVAVAGLPEKRDDHAIVMSQFAFACQKRMCDLTKTLEVALGPGTSDLSLRIGLHSGSVTAGVLRGEKSRFQIFGDVMNVASRMESTGTPDRIQVSQDTANLLCAGNKSHWLTQRDDLIVAKGKGQLQTYFVKPKKKTKSPSYALDVSSTVSSQLTDSHWGTLSFSNNNVTSGMELSDREDRLVDWCTDLLSEFLVTVVSSRRTLTRIVSRRRSLITISPDDEVNEAPGSLIMSYVNEAVTLPDFDRKKMAAAVNKDPSILPAEVRCQLREFVANIAAMYHDNLFHNFEHASHVLLSANKLMKRIISPDSIDTSLNPDKIDWEDMHNSSFGISSDPLTQFTIVFSALIHDVDHSGVPNAVLVEEHNPLAVKFDNKSVAEQNSVEIALTMLAEPRFRALKSTICATTAEKTQFRQILINSILATDILDADLKKVRQERWATAFSRNDITSKATVVIEHIIQASDVSHTMQHWHIFRKWNEKLFRESYHRYRTRGGQDPGTKWYEQEISFFDNYVIPLAKNLKECGVFGVSSDEYLNYALANRDEWIIKGRAISRELIAKVSSEYQTTSSALTMAGRAA